MRLKGQERGGYYAAPPEAVAEIAKALRPPVGQRWDLLDCCAGEGLALVQLAGLLACPPEQTWGVELNPERGQTLTAALHPGNALAPCSFFGCDIRRYAFSCVWCNPPFDDQIAGGVRMELEFLNRATDLLVSRGVILFVCPKDTADHYDVQQFLLTWYEDLQVTPFPEGRRKYKEVVVLGRLRKERVNPRDHRWRGLLTVSPTKYDLPPSHGPGNRWRKTEFTESELLAALATSKLRQILEPPAPRPLASPPMAPGSGHRALLLASGRIDGLIRPEGEPPHVVRGVCRKVEEIQDEQEEETKGSITTKTTYIERMKTSVRVLDHTGKIVTLTQE